MKHVAADEYRAIRDLRVKENEGGSVVETLAAGCVVILASILCSMFSSLFWPSPYHSVEGKRMLRRKLVVEILLLVVPLQALLSSGLPFWKDESEPIIEDIRRAVTETCESSAHALYIVHYLQHGFSWLMHSDLPPTLAPQLFTYELLSWLIVAVVFIACLQRFLHYDVRSGAQIHVVSSNNVKDSVAHGWRGEFTIYRGSLMLMTCMSILAVDFSFFPSRFMKTEAFGVSLMDIGVGSFMLSGGIAGGVKATEAGAALMSIMATDNTVQLLSRNTLRKFLKPSGLLLLLGMCRTIAIYAFDHPQHVTEYGVHWNFFFTLAALPIVYLGITLAHNVVFRLLDALACSSRIVPGIVISVVASHPFRSALAMVAHQVLLSFAGLTAFIFSEYREGFVASNKEGLCTLLGFTSIYSAGVDVGFLLRRQSWKVLPKVAMPVVNSKATRNHRSLAILLSFVGSMLIFWLAETYVQRASRRLCNLGFIAFVFGFNALSALCLSLMPDALPHKGAAARPVSIVLEAINLNQLIVFLVSNVLVGLLNQATQTIFIERWMAHCLLGGYAVYGCVLGWKLKRSGIVIR